MILCHLKIGSKLFLSQLAKNRELCTTGTGFLGKLDHL